MLRNTQTSFGWLSQALHWSMALLLSGLFVMGLYMTSLNYYDPWYHSLPWWHKSFGLLTFFLLLIRTIWTLLNSHPKSPSTHKTWEKNLARAMQKLFYALIFLIALSGYLFATAKGKGIEFFNGFVIPAPSQTIEENYVDLIANAHEIMAILLAILVVLHALAALKHHLIDKDQTLTRMLGNKPRI